MDELKEYEEPENLAKDSDFLEEIHLKKYSEQDNLMCALGLSHKRIEELTTTVVTFFTNENKGLMIDDFVKMSKSAKNSNELFVIGMISGKLLK